MSLRTITQSIETESLQSAILRILADPTKIPRWAPAFADRVLAEGDGWVVEKGDSRFSLTIRSDDSLGVADYLREIAPGVLGGAYIRVLPRPGGGCVVVMTLPVREGQENQVAAILSEELKALVALAGVVEGQ